MQRRMMAKGPQGIPAFTITVKSDNAGTSGATQFTIPITGVGYLYDVETSDGYTASGLTGSHTITFPSGAGTYDVFIRGDFPRIYFNNGGDSLKVLDIKQFDFYSNSINQVGAFYGCSNLTITASDLGDFSLVTSFSSTWRSCSSLTSFPLINTISGFNFSLAWLQCSSLTSFPLIDTSGANDFSSTWRNCSSLTSFPLINTSNATNFNSAWRLCSSLTSFPLIDTSGGMNFGLTWFSCTSLTSFPLLNFSSANDFSSSWRNCTSLTSFPANAFDGCLATNFNLTFSDTALTQASIDGILVSINTNGTSGGTFAQSGGSAPSATGETAIDALRVRGWTVAVTGGY